MKQTNIHIPVMLQEAVTALIVSPDGVYVDGTFGRGGHSREILNRLSKDGKLIAVDKDPDAVSESRLINDKRFAFFHNCFSHLNEILAQKNIPDIDGVMVDLGVSSPQLDDAARGFSFRHDGPLDMRMDSSQGQTLAQWLSSAEEHEISNVILQFGEERFAKKIAKEIVINRSARAINTTMDLVNSIKKSGVFSKKNRHPATKTFQAFRIHINKELEVLRIFLSQCLDLLKPGGRLVTITFHSLEDRIVKQFLKYHSSPAVIPREIPIVLNDLPTPRMRLLGKAIFPSDDEIKMNPKSRSAILRIGERSAV